MGMVVPVPQKGEKKNRHHGHEAAGKVPLKKTMHHRNNRTCGKINIFVQNFSEFIYYFGQEL